MKKLYFLSTPKEKVAKSTKVAPTASSSNFAIEDGINSDRNKN